MPLILAPQLITPRALPPYAADAVVFDGTSDYVSRSADLTGSADGKQGTASFWFDLAGGDGSEQVFLMNEGTRFLISRETSNKIIISCRNTTPSDVLNILTTNTHVASAGYKHFIAAWDMSVPVSHIFINNTSDNAGGTENDDTIEYTRSNWRIGATTFDGSLKFNGNLFDLWFDDTFLDISVEANRRKFIDAAGKPVDLGADGSTPTGSQPLIFLHLDDGETPADNFAANAGTGGGMTVTGALAVAGSSPTD